MSAILMSILTASRTILSMMALDRISDPCTFLLKNERCLRDWFSSKEIVSAIADTISFLTIRFIGKTRVAAGNPLP